MKYPYVLCAYPRDFRQTGKLRSSADEMSSYYTAEIDDKPLAFVQRLIKWILSPEGPGYQAGYEEGAHQARLNYEP